MLRFCVGTMVVLPCLLVVEPVWAALRCDDGLVDTGDLAVQVLAACGQPDFIDHWRGDALTPHGPWSEAEQWTYNFGPSQLLFTLRLRDGRVRAIETHGYGFRAPTKRDCTPYAIEVGMSKYELLALCGQPVQRDALFVLRPLRRDHLHGRNALRQVYQETWVYNFGDSRLLRLVTLENGQVVAVDTGGYGFEEHDW